MLHDKIYHQARELYALEDQCDNLVKDLNKAKDDIVIASKEHRRLLPKGFSPVHEMMEGHSPYTNYLMMMTEEPAVGFYFDESVKFDKEMAVTGASFLKAGFLKMPFKTVVFNARKYFHDKLDLSIWAKSLEEKNTIIFDVINKRDYRQCFYELQIDTAQCYFRDATKPNWDIAPIKTKEDDAALGAMARAFCHMLMLLNHPVYEKKVNEIAKSVNDKRVRKGKKSLSKYIYVKMKPHIKAALQSGVGTVRCPHWRRGHVRHISHGRVIPVQACLVNWDGDPTEIQKKVYII